MHKSGPTFWKQAIAIFLAVAFLPLAGPLYLCTCKGELFSPAAVESCSSCCDEEALPEPQDACPDDCNQMVRVDLVLPETTTAPALETQTLKPPVLIGSSDHTGLFDSQNLRAATYAGTTPPPGTTRTHLRLRVLLI